MSAPAIASPSADNFPAGSPALVMFVGDTTIRWLKVLKRGFRHCFVAVNCADTWVVYDPLAHRTDLTVLRGFTGQDLARWYRDHGIVVIPTTVTEAPVRVAPLRPFSCVEAVKRILGIHARWVMTPWQLYRLLTQVPIAGITSLTRTP